MQIGQQPNATEEGQRIKWSTEVLDKIKSEVLPAFWNIGVEHPTIRAVYYKLFSMGVIPSNNQQAYKSLDRMLTDVRMSGDDDLIRPDTFADESRPDIDEFEDLTPIEFANAWADYVKEVHTHYEPYRWHRQPEYVEVWIEKQAMYETFKSVLGDKQVVVQSSRGFNSVSSMYKAHQRLWRIQQATGKEIVILYFGDLDPSGDAMDDDILKKLTKFSLIYGQVRSRLVRVGVRPEHVQEYNLPQDPDAETAERVKNKDTRYRRFIARYGRLYLIELDALAGKEPEAFSRLVNEAVDKHFNESIWEQECKDKLTQEKAKRALEKRIMVLPRAASESRKRKRNNKRRN